MGHTQFSKEKIPLIPFFTAHHLMIVYICTKFHENILNSIKVIERT